MIRTNQDIKTQLYKFIRTKEYPIPFVLDANWVNGLGVIRSLGQIGINSIAINYDRTGVGLYSKYALGIVGPNPWNDARGLIDMLIETGSLLPEKGVLFVTDDKYLEVLSAAKIELQPYFLFSFPDIHVLKDLLDKQIQYAAAEKAGLSHPRSLIIRDMNDLKKWEMDAFPMVIKGVSGKDFFQYFGRQALEVNTYNEAKAIVQNGKNIDYIMQEIIPGGEENLYTLGCYMSPEGEAKGIFTGRKLRQYPRYYGTCTIGESVVCDDIVSTAIATLRNLNFHGIAQVECKRDPRDKKLKLIEINGRFWKWHSLATAAGVNLAACAYKDITGWGDYAPRAQKYGLKWVVLLEDFRGVRQDISNREFNLLKWLRTISPPFISGLFDWNDLRPFLMKIYYFLKMKLTNR